MNLRLPYDPPAINRCSGQVLCKETMQNVFNKLSTILNISKLTFQTGQFNGGIGINI